MNLKEIVPFGRSYEEYKKMFMLSNEDLEKKIIGIGDGPASFNAEMFLQRKAVVSVDPLYVFSADAIEKQFYSVVAGVISQVKSNSKDYLWSFHGSPEQLRENRIKTLKVFLQDYEKGRKSGRYLNGKLPLLDFEKNRFDLALCSHLLFLYSDHLTYEFHRKSILEMLRIASEVRIFPILTLSSRISSYIQPLVKELLAMGFQTSIIKVDYEFQKEGNQMLCIKK